MFQKTQKSTNENSRKCINDLFSILITFKNKTCFFLKRQNYTRKTTSYGGNRTEATSNYIMSGKLLHCSDHSFFICQVRCWHKLLLLHPEKFSFIMSRMSPKNLHFYPILSAAAATPSSRFMLWESLNFMAHKSFSAIKLFFFPKITRNKRARRIILMT